MSESDKPNIYCDEQGGVFVCNYGFYNKVIPKMGLTRDEHIGNLIINFTVDFPSELSAEQIESLAKIL